LGFKIVEMGSSIFLLREQSKLDRRFQAPHTEVSLREGNFDAGLFQCLGDGNPNLALHSPRDIDRSPKQKLEVQGAVTEALEGGTRRRFV
jgi:hypothetical protein